MNKQKVLRVIEENQIFLLKPSDFDGRHMTSAEMQAIFKYFNAFWQYPDKPRAEQPHALLKSELHSDGFIACKEVLDYPALCAIFANEMLKVIKMNINPASLARIGVVTSPAYSAISLGTGVAQLLSEQYNPGIKYVIAEKDQNGNPTVIRGGLNPELKTLVINELMTTRDGSTFETKNAVLTCNGDNPAPTVIEPAFILVHRSTDHSLADGSAVKFVFHLNIENYQPDACPYCSAGSKALKPKEGKNWEMYFKN
ncbi:MAG: hypothetical protein UV02_C0063G0003 [Candidatus Kuenenbacteria bacterium GW2011_GWA2_42_15]|uniref:Orotate phosphoribosyltransferase n=1 Tax=Candidatus Kuenenbacteria bacterium GW2011_GWA2_42_15 TaxID=1618677 RepID=A0A0G1AZR6_9BACT|nr:MAG: hypothetical protein UV02_C0063G0003 [Candidatus Kuenenbacteria bacterium GW2011_GWA2_42_15]